MSGCNSSRPTGAFRYSRSDKEHNLYPASVNFEPGLDMENGYEKGGVDGYERGG